MLSAEVSHIPTVASLKTIKRLVSLIHLILKPPFTPSHSEKAACISLVLSSFGKPLRDKMRVTQAESWERAAAIEAHEMGDVVEGGDGVGVLCERRVEELRKEVKDDRAIR